MNSFRFLERGIEAELERQREVAGGGEEVAQETFHFDPEDGSLTPLRSKEYAHDYRYFPEPDLVPLRPDRGDAARGARSPARAARGSAASATRTELGAARGGREHARLRCGARRVLRAGGGGRPTGSRRQGAIANWVTGELVAALREADAGEDPLASKVTPEALVAALAGLVEAKTITHGAGKQVLAHWWLRVATRRNRRARGTRPDLRHRGARGDRRPRHRGRSRGRREGPAGNPKAIGPIVGAVMSETKGTADGGDVARADQGAAVGPAGERDGLALIGRRVRVHAVASGRRHTLWAWPALPTYSLRFSSG